MDFLIIKNALLNGCVFVILDSKLTKLSVFIDLECIWRLYRLYHLQGRRSGKYPSSPTYKLITRYGFTVSKILI